MKFFFALREKKMKYYFQSIWYQKYTQLFREVLYLGPYPLPSAASNIFPVLFTEKENLKGTIIKNNLSAGFRRVYLRLASRHGPKGSCRISFGFKGRWRYFQLRHLHIFFRLFQVAVTGLKRVLVIAVRARSVSVRVWVSLIDLFDGL